MFGFGLLASPGSIPGGVTGRLKYALRFIPIFFLFPSVKKADRVVAVPDELLPTGPKFCIAALLPVSVWIFYLSVLIVQPFVRCVKTVRGKKWLFRLFGG